MQHQNPADTLNTACVQAKGAAAFLSKVGTMLPTVTISDGIPVGKNLQWLANCLPQTLAATCVTCDHCLLHYLAADVLDVAVLTAAQHHCVPDELAAFVADFGAAAGCCVPAPSVQDNLLCCLGCIRCRTSIPAAACTSKLV